MRHQDDVDSQVADFVQSFEEIHEFLGDERVAFAVPEIFNSFLSCLIAYILDTELFRPVNSINYKRLAMAVDSEVLKSFVLSIIDSMTVTDGLISNIVFKNGLSHTFIFKE